MNFSLAVLVLSLLEPLVVRAFRANVPSWRHSSATVVEKEHATNPTNRAFHDELYSFSHDLKITEPGDDFGDFSDEGDKDFELSMARDLYDELRGEDVLLSIEKFIAWDDIQDVLSRGFIDDSTMETIIVEVGVSGGLMTFEQFYEMVDIVNQVSIALESPSGEDATFEDLDMMEDEDVQLDEQSADSSVDAYKWIMDAMMSGMKKREPKDDNNN